MLGQGQYQWKLQWQILLRKGDILALQGNYQLQLLIQKGMYWKVRVSSSLISESFGGGLLLADGRLGRIFYFILPLILFCSHLPLPF